MWEAVGVEVLIGRRNFEQLFGKTIKNSSRQMRQPYAFAANESTQSDYKQLRIGINNFIIRLMLNPRVT